MIKPLLMFMLAIMPAFLSAQSTTDYRSKSSGNWNVISNWEYYDGTVWKPALKFPTALDGKILISTGDTIVYNIPSTIDQVTISVNSTLTAVMDRFRLVNGPGVDLAIYGTLNWNNGTAGEYASWEVYEGGVANMNFENSGLNCASLNVKRGGIMNFLNVRGYLDGCIITNDGTINFEEAQGKKISTGTSPLFGATTFVNNERGLVNFNNANLEFGTPGGSLSFTNRGRVFILQDLHLFGTPGYHHLGYMNIVEKATFYSEEKTDISNSFYNSVEGGGTAYFRGLVNALYFCDFNYTINTVFENTMMKGAGFGFGGRAEFRGDSIVFEKSSPGMTPMGVGIGQYGGIFANSGLTIQMNNVDFSNNGALYLQTDSGDINVNLNPVTFAIFGHVSASGKGTAYFNAQKQNTSFISDLPPRVASNSISVANGATLDFTSGSFPIQFILRDTYVGGAGTIRIPDKTVKERIRLYPENLRLFGAGNVLDRNGSFNVTATPNANKEGGWFGVLKHDGDLELAGYFIGAGSNPDVPDGAYEIIKLSNGIIKGNFDNVQLYGNFLLDVRDSSVFLLKGVCETIWYRDQDADGYGNSARTIKSCTRPGGYTSIGGDCNDNDPKIYPGGPELKNGIDDNCNGLIDENLNLEFRSAASGTWNSISTWEYRDSGIWKPAFRVPTGDDSVVTITNHIVDVVGWASAPSVKIAAGGELRVADGELRLAGLTNIVEGTLTLEGTSSIRYRQNAHLQYFVIRGNFNWTGGTLYTCIVNYGTARITTNKPKPLYALFYNSGKAIFDTCTITPKNRSAQIINNGPGSRMTFNSSRIVGFYYYVPDVRNMNGGTMTLLGENAFVNFVNDAKLEGIGRSMFRSLGGNGTVYPGSTDSTGFNGIGTISLEGIVGSTGAQNVTIDIPVAGVHGSIHDELNLRGAVSLYQMDIQVNIKQVGGLLPDTIIRAVDGYFTGWYRSVKVPNGYRLRIAGNVLLVEPIPGFTISTFGTLKGKGEISEGNPFIPTILRRTQMLKIQGLQSNVKSLTIFDRNGRTSFFERNYGNNKSMQKLPPGIYFYRITTRGGRMFSGKIMITD